MINQEAIREIEGRVDIVDLVGRYVELKQKGHDYWGCCPFHQEKTPSLKVDPERKTWHCFGCGEGGDVVDFLMRIEDCSLSEAVQSLA